MSNTESYFYGQGRISIALRDAITGALGAWRWIGDVSALSIKLTTTKVEHKESYSGQRALVVSFPSEKAASLDMTLNQIDADNLSLALYGKTTVNAAGTVTAEALPEGIVAGQDIYLASPGVSDVVITDSTGAPKTLVAPTDATIADGTADYLIADANFGRITILNVATFVQPFNVAYAKAASKSVGMFTSGQPYLAVRYEGVNLAEANAQVLAQFYKVAPEPLAELALITTGNDVAGMAITAGILLDPTKPATGPFGQFGAITQIGVAA